MAISTKKPNDETGLRSSARSDAPDGDGRSGDDVDGRRFSHAAVAQHQLHPHLADGTSIISIIVEKK